jgi:probable rRNA maturation factor
MLSFSKTVAQSKLNSTSDPSNVTPGIDFHFNVPLDSFGDQEAYRRWIRNAVDEEQRRLLRVDYIFVSDEDLLSLNVKHLGHHTLTDIITFPYQTDPIEAEIYISLERVQDNAQQNRVSLHNELRRVMIHGILHMCGWTDKTDDNRKAMRKREEHYLDHWEAD